MNEKSGVLALRRRGWLEKQMSRNLPEYLQDYELDEIFSDHKKLKHPYAWTLAFFLAQTGARISEALLTKVGDLDFSSRTLRLICLKKKKTMYRIIPMLPRLSNELISWIRAEKIGSDSYLFLSPRPTERAKNKPISRANAYRLIVNLLNDSGIKNDKRAHPHIFRHTFAVRLIRKGTPITVVRKLLGHTSIEDTLIYAQLSDDEGAKMVRELMGQEI